MIEYIIGGIIGAGLMYAYLTFRLHQFGWSWRLVIGKIAEDKLHKKFMKEQLKPYKNLVDR